MWLLKLTLLTFCCFSVASADLNLPNFDGVGSIMDTLKTSGMMDQFKEKFGQMLINQKKMRQEEEDVAWEDASNGGDEEASEDVYDFLK